MKDVSGLHIASLMTGYLAAGLFWGAFAASTPDFQAMSGLDTGGFGLLLFAMTAGAFPAMMFLGRIIHRVQAWALPACLALFAAAAVVLAFADGVISLAIAFFLIGAASGALDIALNMRVSIIEGETGTRLFNRAHAMFPLALLVGSPIAGAGRDAGAGPSEIFPLLAVLLAIAAVFERRVGQTHPESTGEVRSAPARLTSLMICLGAIAALGAFMEMSAQNWAAIFTETVLRSTATAAGIAVSAFTLGLSLGRLAAYLLEARFADAVAIRIGAILGLPAFLLIATSGSLQAMLVGFLLAGMAVGPVEPTVYRVVAGQYGPRERGRALSAVTAVAYLGYLISPPVLGAIAQEAGWAAMWSTSAVAAGVVVLLTVRLARLRRGTKALPKSAP